MRNLFGQNKILIIFLLSIMMALKIMIVMMVMMIMMMMMMMKGDYSLQNQLGPLAKKAQPHFTKG